MTAAYVVTCVIEDCDNPAEKRTLCRHHYYEAWQRGEHKLYPLVRAERDGWVNPLVCVCETPDADPRRDFGMCQVCKRKPLALMKAAS